MAETPAVDRDQVFSAEREDAAYDPVEGEKLAKWVVGLCQHNADARRHRTRESKWDADWDFIDGAQWEGPLPTYRRPIVVNIWRRAIHIALASQLGSRPMLKIVPEGTATPEQVKPWQDALWAWTKHARFLQKYSEAQAWAITGDGGWLKFGYGHVADVPGEYPDVLVSAPHPRKVYPDAECTDLTLTECSNIVYREILDLSTISARYPAQATHVKPNQNVSWAWPGETPSWVTEAAGAPSIAPAGGWRISRDYRRARSLVYECWIDDPSIEQQTERRPIFDEHNPVPALRTTVLDYRDESIWVRRYPFGRVITCTDDVLLRDIPNPFGAALGWRLRWPFVYVPGAFRPSVLWRKGLFSNLEEGQRAINKSVSLLLENFVKVTNAMVIADENAIDDEDWDLLSLVPGVKIRKRAHTDFQVQFPEALPEIAFKFPDFMIRKLEESVGLHDPPLAPGQAVAAKTVAFMQQKGSFLLGMIAMLQDEALERAGNRIVALMVDRYLEGRTIPYFEGEQITKTSKIPGKLPPSVRLRVEAGSGYQELMATMAAMAEAAGKQKRPRQ